MRKHILAAFLIAAQFSFGLGFIPLAHAEGAPIISAVQITGGVGKTAEDFIELYNPGNQPFNLKGYRLVKRSGTGVTDSSIKSWTEDTFIPANGFYLWANTDFVTITTAPDLTTTATLADNNGVALRVGAADTGTIIDSVAWGTSSNGFTNVSSVNPGAGESLVRVNLFDVTAGYVIGASNPRNSSMQVLPPNPQPTPTPTPTVTPTPSVTPTVGPSITPTPTASPSPTPTPSSTPTPTSTPTPVPSITPTPVPTPTAAANTVRINELLPDPTGADTGAEKIELYNYGNSSVSVTGWILDDISASDQVSTNAYVLPSLNIGAHSYLVVTIPAGKFGMNNTGGEVVTLLSPAKQVVSSTSYQGSAQEAKSYSYFASGWKWAELTLGAENIAPQEPVLEPFDLVISEVYAFPNAGESEFVELYNPGDDVVDLGRVTIQVGDRSKVLASVNLDEGEYLAISSSDLPIALRNTGQSIKIFRDKTVELDAVTYPKGKKGESYSLFEDGFLWTTSSTPDEENELVVPEVEKGKAAATQSVKSAAKSVEKATLPKSSTKQADTNSLPAVAGVSDNNSEPPTPPSSNSSAGAAATNSHKAQKWGLILSLGSLMVGGSMLAIYKFGFGGAQVNF